ncbi:MAG TPA: YggT family protein [Gemmatimonadales bacterium]|nr:YggT family protein [Gemmatimonadales bacterium]
MDLTVTFGDLLAITRTAVGVAFIAALVVALTHWAIREGKLEPFSGWAKFVRGWSDPLLAPIETRLRNAGGNPQHAPYWLMGVVVVGGLLLINLLGWLFGMILQLRYAAATGPRGLAYLLLSLTFSVLMAALIIRVFSSWFGLTRHNRWIGITYQLTDWLVEPIRRFMPTMGMFDFSPLVAWLLLSLVRRLVLGAL